MDWAGLPPSGGEIVSGMSLKTGPQKRLESPLETGAFPSISAGAKPEN
jgi:hypothetical protein